MMIVRARSEDASELTRIAHAAKRSWGYPETWIEQWRDLLTIDPEFVMRNETFEAVDQRGILGWCALVQRAGALWLEHIWILPEAMGRGIGRALFTYSLERARNSGFTEMRMEADPNAAGFYERMGAQRIGETVSELDGQARVLPILLCQVPI